MQFLRSNLHNYGIQHREQSAYERTIGQGHTYFQIVFPPKQAKFGINVWERVIRQTGCVHEVQIYTRGSRTGAWVVQDVTKKQKGTLTWVSLFFFFFFFFFFFGSRNLKALVEIGFTDFALYVEVRGKKGMPQVVKSTRLRNRGCG